MLVFAAIIVGLIVGAALRRPMRLIAGDASLKLPPLSVELLTAATYGMLAWSVGLNWSLPAYAWLGAAGVAMGVIDAQHRRLPNVLTLSGYPALGILFAIAAVVDGDWSAYGRAWIGAAILFTIYLGLALIYPAGMGLGDVKLAGVLGLALAWLGWPELLVGAFMAFFLGAVVGVGLMIAGRAKRKTVIPFGPFMLLGALIAITFAGPIVDWYLSFAVPS